MPPSRRLWPITRGRVVSNSWRSRGATRSSRAPSCTDTPSKRRRAARSWSTGRSAASSTVTRRPSAASSRAAASPLIYLYLLQRQRRGKEDRERFHERLGRAKLPRPDGPLIWLHAASVGEAQSVLTLIARLRADDLVETRRDGKNVYYSLARPEVRDVIESLHRTFCKPPRKGR